MAQSTSQQDLTVADITPKLRVPQKARLVPTKREWSRYKLREPGPEYVVYVFVFLDSIIICRLYKLTISDKAQVTLQLTVSLSDLV
jgi:hypothetical protein